METNNNVKVLVDKIVDDLAEEEDFELNGTKLAQDVFMNKESTEPVAEHSKASRCGSPDSPEFPC